MSEAPSAGDYQRVLAHLELQARRRAGEVVEGPPGLLGVFDAAWPVSHTSNRVVVTPSLPEACGADEVLVFVDQAFHGRGLTHRKVDVLDQAAAGRITPALQALGFSHDEVHVMAARPRPADADGPATDVAAAVEEAVVRPLVERGWHVEAEQYTDETVRQLVERRDAIERVGGTTTRLAVLDPATGDAVSKADLLVLEGLAEIDDVLTLPDQRGRGYATALVKESLARAQGCDFVYLEAAADDWPRHLYARLGFECIGSIHEHTLLDVPVEVT